MWAVCFVFHRAIEYFNGIFPILINISKVWALNTFTFEWPRWLTKNTIHSRQKKEPKLPIQKLQWRFLCLPQKSIATYMDNAELRQFDISLTISCLVLSFIYLSILINAFVQYMDLFPLLVVCLCISQSKYYIRL